jgi:serine/threonine protein phosphatase PrpC
MKLRAGWQSIVGKRDNNEDACYVDPRNRFFLVADGMGGQSAGERASGLAVELIPKKLQSIDFEKSPPDQATKIIDDAITQANYEIMALGELDPKLKNMGTTITFVVSVAGVMYVGGVGDSRVYLLRNGSLQQLTTDHSLTQALIEAGTLTQEEAVNHRYRNVLYRYLGCKEGGTGTSPKQVRPVKGDRFLICSDGVTGGADDAQLAKLMSAGTDPQKTAEAIVQAAIDGGSKDNITGVVIFVE